MNMIENKVKYLLWILFLITCPFSFAQIPTDSSKDNFTFLINSDPQMGEQNTQNSRLNTLNNLLSSFVEEVNAKSTKPDFVVWNGDLVWKPNVRSFQNFERIIKPIQSNSILVHGNHDGVLGDEKFSLLQKNIMNFDQLNYSFDYGAWHFVVIGSQEKYPRKKQKQDLIEWLKDDLSKNKKPTMLFMHYHILPVGLSQMEFYSFTPNLFRNQLLETITTYGDTKYVFSGHVHIGIKPSIKTMRQYKNTTFILAPSSVPGRPFGEEFSYYDQPDHPFDDKGYYLEVNVNGHDVSLNGYKIKHPQKTAYPIDKIEKFEKSMDLRAFISESELPANQTLVNGDFSKGTTGWSSSWRYLTDKEPAYTNVFSDNASTLGYKSKYGYWAQDEYLENYQLIKYFANSKVTINFDLPSGFKGGGGYFRFFGYNKQNKLEDMALFHWGDDEHKVKYMHQSWSYNVTGNRLHPYWLNNKIKQNKLNSYTIFPKPKQPNVLAINLDLALNNNDSIEKVGIAYGVWGRVNPHGTEFKSSLKVNEISVESEKLSTSEIHSFNKQELKEKNSSLKFGDIYKKIISEKKDLK